MPFNIMAFQLGIAAPGTFGGGNESNSGDGDADDTNNGGCLQVGAIIVLNDPDVDGETDVWGNRCNTTCTPTNSGLVDDGTDVLPGGGTIQPGC